MIIAQLSSNHVAVAATPFVVDLPVLRTGGVDDGALDLQLVADDRVRHLGSDNINFAAISDLSPVRSHGSDTVALNAASPTLSPQIGPEMVFAGRRQPKSDSHVTSPQQSPTRLIPVVSLTAAAATTLVILNDDSPDRSEGASVLLRGKNVADVNLLRRCHVVLVKRDALQTVRDAAI